MAFRKLHPEDVETLGPVAMAVMIDMGWLTREDPLELSASFWRAMRTNNDNWWHTIEVGRKALIATGQWKERWTAVHPDLVPKGGTAL